MTPKPCEPLAAGQTAPDFTLSESLEKTVTLSELRGKPVVLAFYPADFSPVCGDQMALYNEVLPEFAKHDATILGVSVDGVFCHKAYADSKNLHFSLLSDFEPKGAVSKAYGVYMDGIGICGRALFVIDKNGVIAWSHNGSLDVNPGADGILEALEGLPK